MILALRSSHEYHKKDLKYFYASKDDEPWPKREGEAIVDFGP